MRPDAEGLLVVEVRLDAFVVPDDSTWCLLDDGVEVVCVSDPIFRALLPWGDGGPRQLAAALRTSIDSERVFLSPPVDLVLPPLAEVEVPAAA